MSPSSKSTLLTAVTLGAFAAIVLWFKPQAAPEAIGSALGCLLSTTKPVENFFQKLKKSLMRASLR